MLCKYNTVFLIGVFEENARLLQWLVFFVSSTRSVHLFCSIVQLVQPDQFSGVLEAGECGFDSRTKPQIFLPPKV